MRIVSIGDKSHEMSNLIFWKKKKRNYFYMSFAENFTENFAENAERMARALALQVIDWIRLFSTVIIMPLVWYCFDRMRTKN